MKPPGERWTVAVDCDGVLHSYTTPFISEDVLPDPPVEGAIEWLNEIVKKFDVVVFTTRGRTLAGRQAVARWLAEHGFTGSVEVTAEKPAALLYIDDRAWRFDGANFPSADDVHRARPWNKEAR